MAARSFKTSPDDRAALATALGTRGSTVIGLCAAWCRACREFEATFDAVATSFPDSTFVWLDVEDDHAIAGDVDVTDFPMLAIYHGERPVHFGVSLPQEGVVHRLVASLDAGSRTIDVDEPVGELRRNLLASMSG